MSAKLKNRSCKPCSEGTKPLTGPALIDLINQLPEGWQVADEHHLEKNYTFDDFKQALAFTNRVGEVAENEGHHPDIYLTWGEVRIKVWTHKVGGLTENDFIFAAKTEQLR